jgi:hypothetical protein
VAGWLELPPRDNLHRGLGLRREVRGLNGHTNANGHGGYTTMRRINSSESKIPLRRDAGLLPGKLVSFAVLIIDLLTSLFSLFVILASI